MLGYIGEGNPDTQFLVYSRGTGGGSFGSENDGWVAELEGRFPSLTGRVHTMLVPGGIDGDGYRRTDAVRLVREQVQTLLNIEATEKSPQP